MEIGNISAGNTTSNFQHVLDENLENQCLEELTQYFIEHNSRDARENALRTMDLNGGYIDRFNYFNQYIPRELKENILISGSAVGSELAIAKNFGFIKSYGCEVTQIYVDIANRRFAHDTDLQSIFYDGVHLPFEDSKFSSVMSGHIIEHTESPFRYLQEHLRVLRSGGYFYLEFPNRYHWKELHTGLFSFEYLPQFLRSLALKFLGSRFSFLNEKKRELYLSILSTLKPVSKWQIRSYLGRIGEGKIIHSYSPAPGYVRMIIKK